MALQPFEPITATFKGSAIEPSAPKPYTLSTTLEGPIITAAWSLTSVLIRLELIYILRWYVSNKPAYEQLAEAIAAAKTAKASFEAQIAALVVVEARTQEIIKVRVELYEAGGFTKPLYVEYLEAVESLEQTAAAIQSAKAAVTQASAEIAKLTSDLSEFGLSDAKDALRRSEFPLIVIARLIFEDEVIWTNALDARRMLLAQYGKTVPSETAGEWSAITGEYQERTEQTLDVAGELTPGKPLTLEFEVIGPNAVEGPAFEGPEIREVQLSAPALAIVYDPEPAPAVN